MTDAKECFRHFVVYGTVTLETGYRSNKRFGVVAKGLEAAIRVAHERYPGIVIYDASHQGVIDAIDAEASVLLTELDEVKLVKENCVSL